MAFPSTALPSKTRPRPHGALSVSLESPRTREGLLRTSDDYREQAIRCLQLAQAVDYEPNRALLLQMAQQWLKMAEVAREREARAEQARVSSRSMPQHPEHMTRQ
jgi:hypothetical protein